MPIAELLALYNCQTPAALHHTSGNPMKRSSRARGRRSSRSSRSATVVTETVKSPKENKDETIKEETDKMETYDTDDIGPNETEHDKHSTAEDNISSNVKETEVMENELDDTKPLKSVGETDSASNKGLESEAKESVKNKHSEKKNEVTEEKKDEPMAVDDDDFNGYGEDEDEDDDEDDDEEEDLRKLYPDIYKTKEKRLLRGEA